MNPFRTSVRLLARGILTVLALAATLLTGVAFADEGDDRLDLVRKKGAIEFVVYRDFPPYSYQVDGAFKGVDVEMGEALAAALGLKATFKTFIPGDDLDDDLRNQLWRGTIVGGSVGDVMLHVGADPQYVARQDKVWIFGVYFRETVSLSFDPKKFPDYSVLEDLEGKRVAVELGSIADLYLTNFNDGALRQSLNRYPSANEAVKAFVAGKADATIAPRGELQGLLKLNGENGRASPAQTVQFQGLFRNAWEIGIAVKRDSPKLRDALADALATMIENGQLKAIYARHGMDYQTPGLK